MHPKHLNLYSYGYGFGDSVVRLPCYLGGGSPSLLLDYPRITGSIFTGPNFAWYRYCGLASLKPMSDTMRIRRRVDRSSTMRTTKGHQTALSPSLLPYLFISVAAIGIRFFAGWQKHRRGPACV